MATGPPDRLVRVGVDGTVDGDRADPYPVPCELPDHADADAGGRFVVACEGTVDAEGRAIVRFDGAGRVDRSFDHGVARPPRPLSQLVAAPLPDGGYVAVGLASVAGTPPAGSEPPLVVVDLDGDGSVVSPHESAFPPLPPGAPSTGRWRFSALRAQGGRAVAVVNFSRGVVAGALDVGDATVIRFDRDGGEVAGSGARPRPAASAASPRRRPTAAASASGTTRRGTMTWARGAPGPLGVA